MKAVPTLSFAQSSRVGKAVAATNEMIEYAQSIHKKHFKDEPNPNLLPAIIQALATAYAAQVHAAKD